MRAYSGLQVMVAHCPHLTQGFHFSPRMRILPGRKYAKDRRMRFPNSPPIGLSPIRESCPPNPTPFAIKYSSGGGLTPPQIIPICQSGTSHSHRYVLQDSESASRLHLMRWACLLFPPAPTRILFRMRALRRPQINRSYIPRGLMNARPAVFPISK